MPRRYSAPVRQHGGGITYRLFKPAFLEPISPKFQCFPGNFRCDGSSRACLDPLANLLLTFLSREPEHNHQHDHQQWCIREPSIRI